MNQALKHWREAATLILTAGAGHGNAVFKNKHLPLLEKQLKGWPPKSTFDYEVLLLKRSNSSGFMPNASVFPGGVIDHSDFSSEWIEVFKPYKKEPNFGLGLVRQHPSTRSPIFATDRTKCGSPIPGEVAFRICAIRETFEESGILLLVPNTSDREINQDLTKMVQYDTKEISTWRLKVQDNPSYFIRMCQELHCMPNIWALHEWSNWLTPATGRSVITRRYDTAFFICCLDDKPYTIDDQKEVTSFQWSTPSEVIEDYESNKIWIGPPQFYELSRLCRLSSLHELHRFSRDRALEGCECWMSFIVSDSDNYIQILPGDELYPEEPDWTGENRIILSPDRLKKNSRLHRMVYKDLATVTIHVNIDPKYKHFHPLIVTSKNNTDYNSRL